MPRTAPWQVDVLATADVQAGLITARQLAELGVPGSSISRRTVGFMWTRVLPGVHLVHGGEPSRHQRELAALLYAGHGSQLTGLVALRRYGIAAADPGPEDSLRPAPVHVLIPHERRRLSTGFARIERTHRLPRPVDHGGLALAPLARAAADAVRRLRRERDVLAILSELVQRDLATTPDLASELTAGSRRGSAHFRAAMTHLNSGVRSAPEGDLRKITELMGLSACFGVTIVAPSGEIVGHPDGWCDDAALALEVDSQRYHGFGRGLARTVERNARYARFGIPVYTVMPQLLWDDPRRVGREIRQAYAAASARPRPDVRILDASERSAGQTGWRWGA